MKPDPDNCKCWVGVALGHGGEDFVVAIGSSSCGDTLEADLKKKVATLVAKDTCGVSMLVVASILKINLEIHYES